MAIGAPPLCLERCAQSPASRASVPGGRAGGRNTTRVARTAATLLEEGRSDCGGFSRRHVDHTATTLGAELDVPLDQGEQGVVAAAPHTVPGVEVGTALPDQNLSRVDQLAAEPLHAEAVCV